jgi:hypothetical protein
LQQNRKPNGKFISLIREQRASPNSFVSMKEFSTKKKKRISISVQLKDDNYHD